MWLESKSKILFVEKISFFIYKNRNGNIIVKSKLAFALKRS